MTDFLIVILVGLVLLVIILAVLPFLLSGEPAPKDEPRELPETTTQPIVIRRRPRPTFRRKRTAEVNDFKPNNFMPHKAVENNGGKLRNTRKIVNLDAICRRTGRTRWVCGCKPCQEERARLDI